MSTASVMNHEDDDADQMISRTVRALVSYRGPGARERLLKALGMSRSAYYNRLAGDTAWSAADVKRAAAVLSVPVATLYEGLGLPSVAGAGFEPATSGTRAQVIDLAARRALRRSGEPAAIGVAVGQ